MEFCQASGRGEVEIAAREDHMANAELALDLFGRAIIAHQCQLRDSAGH